MLTVDSADSMLDAWTGWRQGKVKPELRIERDVSVMAVRWFAWFERNSRIFNQKCRSNVALLASTNSYITFWLDNLPAKQWKTFARSRLKGQAGRGTTNKDPPTPAVVASNGDSERADDVGVEEHGRTAASLAEVPIRSQTTEDVERID